MTTLGWRAAKNAARIDQQATAITNTLYDSIVQEMQLTCEVRKQGYGETVRKLVDRAQALGADRMDKDELRRRLVLTMGDFAAYRPVVVQPPQGETTALCLSHDGRRLFAGLHNGRLLVLDADTGRKLGELDTLRNRVYSIAVNPDGGRLVAADQSGAVCVWQRDGDEWQLERQLQLGENVGATYIELDRQLRRIRQRADRDLAVAHRPTAKHAGNRSRLEDQERRV